MNVRLTAWGTVLAATLSAMAGPAMASESVQGVWMRGDGNARVRIAPCGSNLCATNVWVGDTSGGEAVGDKLVLTVAGDRPDRLSGKAFDPKRDMTFSIDMTVKAGSLVTRGCVVGGILCKSVNWKKAQ